MHHRAITPVGALSAFVVFWVNCSGTPVPSLACENSSSRLPRPEREEEAPAVGRPDGKPSGVGSNVKRVSVRRASSQIQMSCS